MFRNWWRGVARSASDSPFKKLTFRPALESLEDRCLLAGPSVLLAPPPLLAPEVSPVVPVLSSFKAADARSAQVLTLTLRAAPPRWPRPRPAPRTR
jgi:hypothetical protein